LSDTREMRLKLKATKWQVVGRIILALIGVYAASVATHTATNSVSRDTVERDARQMDTVVIPAIQKLLEELKYEVKKNAELRERVARLEGALESMPGSRGTAGKPWGLEKVLGDMGKRKAARVETRLPTLRLQHQQMGPSLESMMEDN